MNYPARTTRASILQKTAIAGSGWDDRRQRWEHGFNSLPSQGSCATFNNSEGLAVWLRESANGAVAWKRNDYQFCPEPEIPARMAAAKDGDVEKLLEMLDNDTVARLADKDKLGRTVLHAAAAAGQVDVVRMLAARCAGWPAGFEEETPPATAGEMTEEQQEILRTRSAVRTASSKADMEDAKAEQMRLKKLLQTDGVVTAQTIADVFDDEKTGFIRKSAPASKMRVKSPHFAKWAVTPEPVRTVGDRGYGSRSADEISAPPETWVTMLNMRDRMGNTPLHLAATDGHAQVVDELVYRGAEVETRNLAGRTALHVASMNGHLHIIFILCTAGASARSRDREGRRPVDMTNDEVVVQFLWALVSKEVAVRGGPTPFGYGDGDSHVLINHHDPRFAVENLDFDPDSFDDGSQRLKSAGKVRSMRTSGPIHTGARLPRIRPLTPLEDPQHRKYGHESVGYPRRGTAKTSKSVAFQLEDDAPEDETIEEMRIEGRANKSVHEKSIRCRSGSGWYNFNERHILSAGSQTVSSRVAPPENIIQMEKSHVLLRRKTSALNKSKIQGLDTQTRPQGAQGQARIGGPSEMLRIVDNYPGLFKTLPPCLPVPTLDAICAEWVASAPALLRLTNSPGRIFTSVSEQGYFSEMSLSSPQLKRY